jgi:hypothetical protein
MTSEYIEQQNGGYYIAATRISLDSLEQASAGERGTAEVRIVILNAYPGPTVRSYGLDLGDRK